MTIKIGYKQTEIGVMPRDWEVKKLAELSTFRTGPFGSALHKSDYTNDGVPIINPMHIIDGRIFPTASMTITELAAKNLSEFRLQPHKIIIGRRGDMGRCATVLDEHKGWLCGTGSMIVRPSQSIDANFLQLILSSPTVISIIENSSVGSTMVNLNQATLSNLVIQVPKKQEQTAIAAALSDVDALIGELDKLIAKKRDIKQATMQQLLTGKKRLAGFSGEWEVKRLGELASIQRGALPRPIENPIWFDNNSPVGWVRISDVTKSGIFLEETMQKLSSLGVQNSRPVARGNLIMSICATVGRPIITAIDVCIHDGFVVFDNLRIDKHFLYYSLKFIENDWSKHGQTGSQMNLNTTLINCTQITVPPQEEQTAIATILSDMDADISQLEARRAKTSDVKQGMMQALLTGRIRLVSNEKPHNHV